MGFWSHAKLDQVETGNTIGAKDAFYLKLVFVSSSLAVGFLGWCSVNLAGRDGNVAQQSTEGKMIIALRVICRHVALIGPEDLKLRPIDLATVWFVGQERKEFSGGRTS